GEISVAINSHLLGVPSVSVGNLIGASFVLLLFIVPLLAVASGGVALRGAVSDRSLLFLLGLVALPAVLVLDGDVTAGEGAFVLLAYATMVFALYRERGRKAFAIEDAPVTGSLPGDAARIALSAAAIFFAS